MPRVEPGSHSTEKHPLSTIQESVRMLSEALKHSSPSPQLDAEILVAHALQKNRTYVRAHPEHFLTPVQSAQVLASMRRRCAGEPIAYLIGNREFWSREFKVNHNVLIPRPETELLIEITLERIADSNPTSELFIADLGTGSGAIAITLASELRNAQVCASDISKAALDIAETNAKIHGCDNITFIRSDWFDKFPALRFDLIVSNPPYIADQHPHLQQNAIRFEPIMALHGGTEGLDKIGTLINDAAGHLKPGGYLLLEHGFDQPHAVRELLIAGNYLDIQQFKDLQGHTRATLARTTTR